MAATMPENDNSPDDIDRAALDDDAPPETGAEPDTRRADPAGSAERTVLDGPALENEEMRRGTEDLRSSEEKTAQAREFAQDVARRTEPAGQ